MTYLEFYAEAFDILNAEKNIENAKELIAEIGVNDED